MPLPPPGAGPRGPCRSSDMYIAKYEEIQTDDLEATLDATKRHEGLGYLLSQLQAYQQQLREVQLQSRWREHAAQASPPPPSHHLPPLVPPPSHASAAA